MAQEVTMKRAAEVLAPLSLSENIDYRERRGCVAD